MVEIYILTEGGKDLGFGHITRCLALYDAFKELNINPKLIINNKSEISNLLSGYDYISLNWLESGFDFFSDISKDNIIIIDSYLANLDFYNYISDKYKICAYFDDYNRINYPRGIVINGSIFAKEINYPANKNVHYLLGVDYIPLRKVFLNPNIKAIDKDIKNILITVGGNDFRNLLPSMIYCLSNSFPNINRKIIVNSSFTNLDGIKKSVTQKDELIFSPSLKKLKQLIYEADIAISAAGQTLYELVMSGVPTIMFSVAENQKNNVKGWIKSGIMDYAGNYNDENLNKNILSLILKMKNLNYRKLKANQSQYFLDGNGSTRIASFLLDNLK